MPLHFLNRILKTRRTENKTTTIASKLVSNVPHIKGDNSVTEKLAACPSIVDNLKDIYSDKFLTDVELKTKTNSFPAHKIVLCARSPVFKGMFSNDMKERNSDSIQVDDLEDHIVRQLLLFLYSDSLEDLPWETVSKLYYAADKYQIEKLKLTCSSFFIDNLTTSTAPELLLLAHIHSDSDLKKVVDDFILKHDEQVCCSTEWEKLMEANPQLALQTMHVIYKTKKANRTLSPGYTLFVEEPYASVLLPVHYPSHCHHCYTKALAVVPCHQCSQVRYCSQKCVDESWEKYHKWECGNLDSLHSPREEEFRRREALEHQKELDECGSDSMRELAAWAS